MQQLATGKAIFSLGSPRFLIHPGCMDFCLEHHQKGLFSGKEEGFSGSADCIRFEAG
jgi:hypothetical protein